MHEAFSTLRERHPIVPTNSIGVRSNTPSPTNFDEPKSTTREDSRVVVE